MAKRYPGEFSGLCDSKRRYSEDYMTSWEGFVPAGVYEDFRGRQKAIGRPVEHAVFRPQHGNWHCYIPAGFVGGFLPIYFEGQWDHVEEPPA